MYRTRPKTMPLFFQMVIIIEVAYDSLQILIHTYENCMYY